MAMNTFGCALMSVALISSAHGAMAQDLPLTQGLTMSTVSPLDPSRGVRKPVMERDVHQPLPEEYIWTVRPDAGNAKLVYTFPGIAEQTEPHFFRQHFHVDRVPSEATLYLAGPRSISVWINGQLADRVNSDTGSPLGMHVFMTPVAKLLHSGDNVIAIQAVRGRRDGLREQCAGAAADVWAGAGGEDRPQRAGRGGRRPDAQRCELAEHGDRV